MDLVLLKIAALFYLLASASFLYYVAFLRDAVLKLSPWILFAGFVAHSGGLVVHFLYSGYPNVTQFREAVMLYCWLLVAGYLIMQLKYHLTVLGSIIAPLALLMTLAASAFGTGPEQLPPELHTYWLPVHVILAFLGNAAFALAFAVS